ncbi:MAG: molybdopterin cofactor-binding domain-containing protein, partial [Thermomicrobiales bacterium]
MVRHVDAVVDCGLIINPEAVSHQIEGSIVMGTSSALREQTLFANGVVTNPSFAEYAPITIRETPTITVSFVEDKMSPMGGVGEPGVAPITGAIANAVYDLIGVRIFDTPFLPEKVLAAMQDSAATPAS